MYTHNVMDFGASGTGITNDAGAFQKAFDAMVAIGGGVLWVPPGNYLMAGGARYAGDAQDQQSIAIIGSGSASKIIPYKNDATIFQTNSNDQVLFERLCFVGNPGIKQDCTHVINVATALNATVRYCSFTGIWADHAIVYGATSRLAVEHCTFQGCTGNFGVLADKPKGLSVSDCHFIDYGDLGGRYHSKTPQRMCTAWIRVADATYPLNGNWDQVCLAIERCAFDEGGINGISFSPVDTLTRYDHIQISSCNTYIGPGKGFEITRADKVAIQHCNFRLARDVPMIELIDAGDVAIHHCTQNACNGAMGSYVVDSTTKSLAVIECDGRVQSDTITHVIKNGVTL